MIVSTEPSEYVISADSTFPSIKAVTGAVVSPSIIRRHDSASSGRFCRQIYVYFPASVYFSTGKEFRSGAVDTVLVNDLGTYNGEYPVGKGVLLSDTWGIIKGEFKNGLPHGRCGSQV